MKPAAPEQFRITPPLALRFGIPPRMASDESFGRNGVFYIPCVREVLHCIAADGLGWEHVSVSLPHRCPTWDEMNFVKAQFWDETECVVQFHPPKSEYVNVHPYCLHLWRPTVEKIIAPPFYFVGPKL